MNSTKNRVRVGISIGDINGVGLEVIMKTFHDNRMLEHIIPVVYGFSRVATIHKKVLRLNDFNFNIIDSAEKAKSKKVNLVNLDGGEVKVELGKGTSTSGGYAFKSLEAATNDLASSKIDVLVTAPINKEAIQSSGFEFPGHTEYLASFANEDNYLMFMISEGLRVGVVTGHIPLKDVSSNLNKEDILQKLKVMDKSLKSDFGIVQPKIAVLGLNPHAGEKGKMGDEESEIILPAINAAQAENIIAYGPYAADGFFGSGTYKQFDGVLAMYHDQGLAPFKSLSFGAGINFTAGLPIVRTSPDHGTAFDIAGKGKANEDSFRSAVFLAQDIFNNRQLSKEILSNPLKKQKATGNITNE